MEEKGQNRKENRTIFSKGNLPRKQHTKFSEISLLPYYSYLKLALSILYEMNALSVNDSPRSNFPDTLRG